MCLSQVWSENTLMTSVAPPSTALAQNRLVVNSGYVCVASRKFYSFIFCISSPVKLPPSLVATALLILLPLMGCSKKLPICFEAELPKTLKPMVVKDTSSTTKSSQTSTAQTRNFLVGIDGSGSMLGHAQASDSSSWRGLLQSVNLSAKTLRLESKLFRVGGGTAKEITSDSATSASDPCFFQGCGPYPPVASSLQTLWSIDSSKPSPPLRLLISDLEANQSDISTLIGAMKGDLVKGATAGVLALKLPFQGTVFDSQGSPFFKGALNRPVYLLATGPTDQVQALLEEIRKNMAQKGVRSNELSLFSVADGGRALKAKDAKPIPPEQGAVGLPLLLGNGRFDPWSNGDYRFIKLQSGAKGFSVRTIKPWNGGTERPDLGLVRLERIPLSPEDTKSTGGITISKMVVAGSQLRLDLEVPRTAPTSGVLRATVPVLPEQWWIDWDRYEPKSPRAAEKTDGLLLLFTTLGSQIREGRNAPPAATLCMAYQTTP
jgi:hypothetical protein